MPKKKYDTTISGLISSVVDRITGNTEYETPERKIEQDNRSNLGYYIDNGAFTKYVTQNILPLVGIGSTIVNPVATASTIIGGDIAARVLDLPTKYLTGKTIEENIQPITGNTLAINPGYLVGGAGGIKYYLGAKNRMKEATLPVANIKEIVPILKKHLNYKARGNQNLLFSNPYTIENTTLPQKINGSVASRFDPKYSTIELHENPNTVIQLIENSDNYKVLSSSPKPEAKRITYNLLKDLPKGTHISSSVEAQSASQLSPKYKMKYVFLNKTPKKTVVEGYSTDIMENFFKMKKKGYNIVDSLTTEIDGTNVFSKDFISKYGKYFNLSKQIDGKVLFKDMTPQQVAMWNKEQGPKLGVYINPVTRTANQQIYIK